MTDFHGRNELKLLISNAESVMLASRLGAVLQRDVHSTADGYFIRSVYLDDRDENAYYEKLAGICDRKKYRIRTYNDCEDYIVLECKEKHDRLVNKYSAPLDKESCERLLKGDFDILESRSERVCRELYAYAKKSGVHNSVIVDYEREAFVYPVSNVRITFDRHLHAGGMDGCDIFDKTGVTIPVYPNDSTILEIKYDTFIPQFIAAMLPTFVGVPISISKYCMCRNILESVRY